MDAPEVAGGVGDRGVAPVNDAGHGALPVDQDVLDTEVVAAEGPDVGHAPILPSYHRRHHIDLAGGGMETYVVLRRGGWRTPEELEEAAERSRQAGEAMPDGVRWIRTYVIAEEDGSLGTVCVYEATGPDALRRHAVMADLPVDEIRRVAGMLVAGPDPAGVGA